MTDLDAFLDALETTAGAHGYKVITAGELTVMIREARAKPATPEHWSDWLRHRQGDPCPVPPSAKVETRKGDEQVWPGQAGYVPWHCVTSFRYHTTDPAGWLPRGDWIPPAELWRDDCSVRCEWTMSLEFGAAGRPGTMNLVHSGWDGITHIRLVARKRKPELPEWLRWDDGEWCITGRDGYDSYHRFPTDPDDLDRIAEACTKLAARERARRAK